MGSHCSIQPAAGRERETAGAEATRRDRLRDLSTSAAHQMQTISGSMHCYAKLYINMQLMDINNNNSYIRAGSERFLSKELI